MYAGRIVEVGPAVACSHEPRMPYSAALLEPSPRSTSRVTPSWRRSRGARRTSCSLRRGARSTRAATADRSLLGADAAATARAAVERRRFACWNPVERRWPVAGTLPQLRDDATGDVAACAASSSSSPPAPPNVSRPSSDVCFDISKGETLGLVGESGAASRPPATPSSADPADGRHRSRSTGRPHGAERTGVRRLRPMFQMIFQDPLASLNPRRTVRDIVAEPLRVWRRVTKATGDHASPRCSTPVGLDAERSATAGRASSPAGRRSASASPGRSCSTPSCWCATSRSRRSTCRCRRRSSTCCVDAGALRLTMLFIAHDLAVVKNVSDRFAVMYLGKLCEIGDADADLRQPAHPYTGAARLRSAVGRRRGAARLKARCRHRPHRRAAAGSAPAARRQRRVRRPRAGHATLRTGPFRGLPPSADRTHVVLGQACPLQLIQEAGEVSAVVASRDRRESIEVAGVGRHRRDGARGPVPQRRACLFVRAQRGNSASRDGRGGKARAAWSGTSRRPSVVVREVVRVAVLDRPAQRAGEPDRIVDEPAIHRRSTPGIVADSRSGGSRCTARRTPRWATRRRRRSPRCRCRGSTAATRRRR